MSALSVGGSYDVTSVWLVIWPPCFARRSRHLFWAPAFNRDPAFIRTWASNPLHLL